MSHSCESRCFGRGDELSNHVTRQEPPNNALDVAVSTVISVTFDDSIRFVQLTPALIRVRHVATALQIEGLPAYDQATRTLSFTPRQPLEYDHDYVVSVDPDEALEGADRATLLSPFHCCFRTAAYHEAATTTADQ